MVFADSRQMGSLDDTRIPSYLDVPAALAAQGPRYTFPSPVLRALAVALEQYATPEKARKRYEQYAHLGQWVRRRLRELGIQPLAPEACAGPVVTTFAAPASESSVEFVSRCRSWGYLIGGQSRYLSEKRLVQLATMGAITQDNCAPLFNALVRWRATSRRASEA